MRVEQPCCTLSHAAAHCASCRVSVVDPHGFCRVGWAVALAVAFRKLAPGCGCGWLLWAIQRGVPPLPLIFRRSEDGGSVDYLGAESNKALRQPRSGKRPLGFGVQSRVQCVPT